mmetsp:Transcript_13420/g.39026  ORF Transcript_13420/g.39026 Transcript_13420/m.39026 type:complete len:272 (-) Transcript_13420:296-1111(-)
MALPWGTPLPDIRELAIRVTVVQTSGRRRPHRCVGAATRRSPRGGRQMPHRRRAGGEPGVLVAQGAHAHAVAKPRSEGAKPHRVGPGTVGPGHGRRARQRPLGTVEVGGQARLPKGTAPRMNPPEDGTAPWCAFLSARNEAPWRLLPAASSTYQRRRHVYPGPAGHVQRCGSHAGKPSGPGVTATTWRAPAHTLGWRPRLVVRRKRHEQGPWSTGRRRHGPRTVERRRRRRRWRRCAWRCIDTRRTPPTTEYQPSSWRAHTLETRWSLFEG